MEPSIIVDGEASPETGEPLINKLQWSRRSSSTERIRTNHSVIFTGYTSKCEHLRAG